MNIAFIIAGGKGKRFGTDRPKQFFEIRGKSILEYTIDIFDKTSSVDDIAVVCISSWHEYVNNIRESGKYSKLKYIIEGGTSRFFSIYNGVTFFENKLSQNDYIMIHDAVRPCVTRDMINESFETACKYRCATLAVAPSFDTMYISEDGKTVNGTYPREKIFKGQTPETLCYNDALKFYKAAKDRKIEIDATSELLMKFNQPIRLTKGSQRNIKITTLEDIAFFKTVLTLQQ